MSKTWTVWVSQYPFEVELESPEVGEELTVEGVKVVITSINRATLVIETRLKK